MTLSRDDILSITDLPSEIVDVPEWDGKVRVRGLSANELDTYERSLMEQMPDGSFRAKDDLIGLRARFVVRCLVNDDGTRMFSDEDAEALGPKSGAAIDRIWKVARRLSGKGEQEELAETFAVAQSTDSSSE